MEINKEKEAEYYKAKHIMEDNLHLLKDERKRDIIKLVGIKNYERFMEERDDPRKELPEIYLKIQEVLRKYVILDEEYYPMIALWIIGTYAHESFNTFPLLFINATKGSGKSRLIRLVISLSRSGKLVSDLRESVLFRTAKGNTIGIDEFENVGSKEVATLRTMLNSAYKKGCAVERMKKVVKDGKEEFVVERYDLFTPVALANIWGVEEVLSDRCLTILMEKSTDPVKTKLIEDFEVSTPISAIKRTLEAIQCSLCGVVTPEKITDGWNDFLLSKNKSIYTIHNNNSTTYTTPHQKTYEKILKSDLDGRNLELFYPLIMIAGMIGEEVVDNFLKIAQKTVAEKRQEEYTENWDISLVDFISQRPEYQLNYTGVHDLTIEFRQFILADEDIKWLNSRWMGRALKRLKLITSKRRISKGVEVTLNSAKAKDRIKMFKTDEKEEG